MQKEELAQMELKMIREEMLTIKKCQHNFLMFEIAGVGTLLGIAVPLLFQEKMEFHYSFLALVPIIIIFPCLFIILDKAISINRIAAIFPIFEYYTYSKKTLPPRFIGWEVGNIQFRNNQSKLRQPEKGPAGVGTQGPNRFYYLVFFISIILAVSCYSIWISLYHIYLSSQGINIWMSDAIFIKVLIFIVILFFSIWGWYTLKRVIDGFHTIISMTRLWWEIIAEERESFPDF